MLIRPDTLLLSYLPDLILDHHLARQLRSSSVFKASMPVNFASWAFLCVSLPIWNLLNADRHLADFLYSFKSLLKTDILHGLAADITLSRAIQHSRFVCCNENALYALYCTLCLKKQANFGDLYLQEEWIKFVQFYWKASEHFQKLCSCLILCVCSCYLGLSCWLNTIQ